MVAAILVASADSGAMAAGPAARARPSSFQTTALSTASGRVDLGTPTFSNPTSVTNPLFPKSTLGQVVQLGVEAGDALRFEATQLEETRIVTWNGRLVETVVTHFVAYSNGRILEVALDFYAQADDGSVWYFGEEVDNYEDGVVVNHDGTWLAGRDGPPGMIMPANPKVGDVYRPENIPGFVFEEATVKAVDQTVAGPRGEVHGAMLMEARLMDGTVEEKLYAPGYGEFRTLVASLDELYHVALAVPSDALDGPVPGELSTISKSANEVFHSARANRWDRVSSTVARMVGAWDRYRIGEVPELLDDQMSGALDTLAAAVAARVPADVRQAAIDVARASLDLQLRYRNAQDVDEARLGTWQLQLTLDWAARDSAAVAGDRATIQAIRDRIDD